MFVRRHLFLVSLLVTFGSPLPADEIGAECGALLNGPVYGNAIYVFCDSLSGKSKAEAHSVIEAVLDQHAQRIGETQIIFLSDPAVLADERENQDIDERLASWGDAVVGKYDTNSGLLMYRSSSDGKWRKLYLGIS